MRTFFPVFTIFLAFLSLDVQTGKTNFNRERTFDVQHYLIKTSFDRKEKIVFGDTMVSLKPIKNGFDMLELDADGLNFKSVQLEPGGQPLKFNTKNKKVLVTLDQSYSAKDLIKVRFVYSAKPEKGIYFVSSERTGAGKMREAQIWTQGEPEEARFWFPAYDFPDDKATTEQFITVQSDETAISNGELIGTAENQNGTKTFHYRMPMPHPVYLTSFVVGKYLKITDSYKNITLGIYLYPGKEQLAQTAFGKTKEMMRIFEELTGIDYPFNKYDQTIVAKFGLGGMENITATTFSDEQIFYADFDFGKSSVEDLVSHELAHSWFGNLVTCRNWAELWLNESFATFMEAAYREKMYGRADYMRKISADVGEYFAEEVRIRKKHGLFNQLARPDDSIFNAVNYQKGGAVIHTLRETVGDRIFWKAINLYLERHKFGNVETADLQKAFEETAGKDLDWFFKQWMIGSGYPKLEIKPRYHAQTKTLTLDTKQTQKSEDLTPSAFILPLEIEIETASGTITEKIKIKKREESFSLRIHAAAIRVIVDPREKIPVKTVRLSNLELSEKSE